MAGPDMRVFVPLLLFSFLSSAVDSEPSEPTTGGDDDFEGEWEAKYGDITPWTTPSVLLYLVAGMLLCCPLLMFCGFRVRAV